MRVDPRSLVRRLTKTATRFLEAAVGRAVSLQHGEVGVEHLLSAMFEAEDSECALLLAHLNKSPQRVSSQLQRQLERVQSSRAGRPVFSDSLLMLLENAWLWASLERGESHLRSGALLVPLLERPGRYLNDVPSELDSMSADEVKRGFDEALGTSAESFEAEAGSGEGTARAGEAPRGDGALGRFTQDLTAQAQAGAIDPALGRHRETRQMINILARRRKNNPILVGEPGVGKTALVEAFAQHIADGDVPDSLRNVQLLSLDLGMLQAGASVRGEFEQRLKAVINEVKAATRPVVLSSTKRTR